MDTEYGNIKEDIDQRPGVFIKKIIFNDSTELSLLQNSIIVFTGANNCGKSQVLKDVENGLNTFNDSSPIVIKKCEYCFKGSLLEDSFIREHFVVDKNGHYKVLETNTTFHTDTLSYNWKNRTLDNELYRLFVLRLSTELRLTSSNNLIRNSNATKSPIYKLYNNDTLAQKISDYFHQAFGVDLVVNRNDMMTVPLHIGQAPDKTAFTLKERDEYYNKVEKLPTLQEQGDGMRSFASILLDTFTSEYSITLIDEPEAFLHPPQARLLGKMLAENNPNNRQLLISTHSEDFLQGLLDSANLNVTVFRINREGSVNKMSYLKNKEIKKLWGNPLLRYSNILSGLFHDKVIVCESDNDCLFYQAVLNAIYEFKNEISPNILFTHCGGKTRIKDVVSALKAVKVPVVAICDFDLINATQNLKPIIESFGLEWNGELSANMKIIYDNMNAKNQTGQNSWAEIKKIGKTGFTGSAPAAYDRVEAICKNAGLFVVPVGEMECFDKTVNKEKKDWVYHVLENYNLGSEVKLEEARKFVQAVVDYKLIEDSDSE